MPRADLLSRVAPLTEEAPLDRLRTRRKWTIDSAGIGASVVCLVHCLVAPVLVLAGAAVPVSHAADDAFHVGMLVLVVPLSGFALWIGCRRHRDVATIALGTLGLVGLAIASLYLHDPLGEAGERIAMVGASVLLGLAHLRNYRLCRSEDCEHDAE